MADFPVIPAGQGLPLVDLTTGEPESTVFADWIRDAVVAGSAQSGTSDAVGAFMRRMQSGRESPVVSVLGDSTSAASTGWFNLLMEGIGDLFPSHTVERRDWSDANQRYELVPTVVQVGTAGARRFVATGASTDRFFIVADSAGTSPTSAVRAEFDLMVPAFGAAFTPGGKYITGTDQRSWFVQVNADGTVSFFFSSDGTAGTQLTRTSTAAIPGGLAGSRFTLRVNFIGDNGASGNSTSFYYSTDRGANWTQIGTTVVNAGVQSIYNGTAPTQLNARGGAGNSTGGAIQYYGLKVFLNLTATTRPAIDFDTALWNGYGSNATVGSNIAQFTDFVGNVVQVDGTGQGGAMSGAPVLFVLNGAVSGQTISYANDGTRFPKLTPNPADLVFINYSHNEVGLIDYRTPYVTLTDAIIAKWPDAGIVATIQNQRKSPAANIVEHAIRGDEIASLAGSRRWAVVDARGYFAATGTPDTYVSSDGIHPTQPGYDLIAAQAQRLFTTWTA